jgi:phosphomannomutase
MSVVVDVGNGVAGRATPEILRMLGGRVVALDAGPEGTFPARDPKPTAESLERTCAFVAAADVAMGVAHDGDGDRVVVIDETGAIVHEDTVLAVLAEHFVRRAVALALPLILFS